MALRRNILLFHQGALGDFVLTWPIAMALARIHPQSRVFYVTHAQKGKLAEKALGVEWADAEAGWHALFGDGGRRCRTRRAGCWRGRIRSSASCRRPTAPFVRQRAAACAGGERADDQPEPAGRLRRPRDRVSARAAPPLARGACGRRADPPLDPARGDRRHAAGRRRVDVVIHPGSGSPAKNWPVERYLELIQRLRDAGDVGPGAARRSRRGALAGRRVAPARRRRDGRRGRETYVDLMAELLVRPRVRRQRQRPRAPGRHHRRAVAVALRPDRPRALEAAGAAGRRCSERSTAGSRCDIADRSTRHVLPDAAQGVRRRLAATLQ